VRVSSAFFTSTIVRVTWIVARQRKHWVSYGLVKGCDTTCILLQRSQLKVNTALPSGVDLG
jgi:hypothetical protein